MFYTCTPGCTDPKHQHSGPLSAAARAAPAKAATSARPVARTRSGKAKVVDLHCHYLNPEVNAKTAKLNAAQYDPTVIFADELTRETNVKQMKTRAPKLSGVTERLKDMDRMGVDIQAVCPAPYHFFYFTEPDYGAELAREVNEGIAKVVADTPDRFVGLGSVPLQDAQLAVRELDYAVKNLGLRGVEICTNVNGKNLTDPSLGLEKFFARCEELGVVIFMHPLGYTQADRLTHHYFNNVIGNPLDSTVAVSHLIFDGVMARHPKLKVVVAHGGGFIAHYWARMDHAWRARPDCRTVIKRKPSSYLEKFYFDTITFDPEMLKRLIDRYGADHVVLGTDYPYDMGEDDPLGLVAQVKRLPKADRDLIVGGNAARLLKIKF
ncbi:amidohydrolase family protein [Caenimonas terrae]|uniref:Amidohydrolase family protein n=1 Tax=Caenimonas terrae TaxID=696074 RepID=A0ABW0N720_9BURK